MAKPRVPGVKNRHDTAPKRPSSGRLPQINSKSTGGGRRLCSISEVPQWLRFNPYILGGYRPPLSVWQGTLSLFQLHNESGNVWSHLLPGLLFTFLAVHHCRVGSSLWPAISSGCAALAIAMWCSVAYHLYMPCCRSHAAYCVLLKLDVVAIILALAVSQFVTLAYGYPCVEVAIQRALAAGFYAIAMLAIAASLTLRSIKGRAALGATFCALRFLTSAYIYGAKASHFHWYAAAGWHAAAYGLTFCGGTVNAARFPERGRPGRFDYWLNSHQLMHILMSFAMFCTYRGILVDTMDFEGAHC
eukprot:EG_transcript_16108